MLAAITIFLGLWLLDQMPIWFGMPGDNVALNVVIYGGIALVGMVLAAIIVLSERLASKFARSMVVGGLFAVWLSFAVLLAFSTLTGFLSVDAPMVCETYAITDDVTQHHCILTNVPNTCSYPAPHWEYVFNVREGWSITWLVESQFSTQPNGDFCF